MQVKRLFNRTKRIKTTVYWETLRNSDYRQRDYSKAIVIAKRKSWKNSCEDIESASKASRLGRILKNTSHLGCLKLSNGESIEESPL